MGGGSFKYLIPVIIAVILLSGVLLSNKFITKQTVGSIYNIEEAKNNFDNIQIGDSINYEVNGYSDWQVIGKDGYEGTIDVVSKTNTENLALEYNQTKEYYENKLQETANKYTDNNYAINARTVSPKDFDYFDYDNNFLSDTISDTNIITSQGIWNYNINTNIKNNKMYIIPYVKKSFDNPESYSVGDTIEYTNNGIDRWVIATTGSCCTPGFDLIPETPIELVIESVDDDIRGKADQIIQSFNNDVNEVGYYLNGSRWYSVDLMSLIPNFFNQQTEKIWIYNGSCMTTKDNMVSFSCQGMAYYDNGEIITGGYFGTVYTDTKPKTFGYRPVVTLKVKSEMQDKEKKEISNSLQVGDNVKYEAKGYKNWKVLSIDTELGTVDIISGGIVKNLTLSGKDDWDNYEDIIQREVDEYKSDGKAKKASTVTTAHINLLNKIDNNILSRYWLLSKYYKLIREYSFGSEGKKGSLYYDVIDVADQDKKIRSNTAIKNIVLYVDYIGNAEIKEMYSIDFNMYKTMSSLDYTAGLRPVITLKLDDVEKLSDKEVKEIEKETKKQERIYIKEQETKNKDYKGPSKVDDTTSSTGNSTLDLSNDSNNTNSIEKIVYKDKPLYKYGFIIFLITSIIELIIIMLLLKKIKR